MVWLAISQLSPSFKVPTPNSQNFEERKRVQLPRVARETLLRKKNKCAELRRPQSLTLFSYRVELFREGCKVCECFKPRDRGMQSITRHAVLRTKVDRANYSFISQILYQVIGKYPFQGYAQTVIGDFWKYLECYVHSVVPFTVQGVRGVHCSRFSGETEQNSGDTHFFQGTAQDSHRNKLESE